MKKTMTKSVHWHIHIIMRITITMLLRLHTLAHMITQTMEVTRTEIMAMANLTPDKVKISYLIIQEF
jgi:hypothetical protein